MSNVLDCLQERGLVDALTSEALRVKLERPLRVYLGFDPTADSLHLGNLVGILVLSWFQRFGHSPVIVLGGATGRIGDPSGKSVERLLLPPAQILENIGRIRRHFEEILDFSNPACRPIVLNNDEWFSHLPVIDFLRDIGKHFRLGSMLAKESVRSRLASEEGISFTEFSYQILQAYDFYVLAHQHDVQVQLGGSDQWGNITAGTELVRKLSARAVFGLTFPLLTRSDGKKFGKTEEGAIWLAADRCSPYQFYQYLIQIPDDDVIKMLRMLTFLPMAEIRQIEAAMRAPDTPPNTAQRRLAEEVTRIVHGEAGLEVARRASRGIAPGSKTDLDAGAFQEIAADVPNVTMEAQEVMGQRLVDVMVRARGTTSKSEGVRLIQNGGAYLNNEKVEDLQLRLGQEHLVGGEYLLLGIGKRKKILIRLKNPLV